MLKKEGEEKENKIVEEKEKNYVFDEEATEAAEAEAKHVEAGSAQKSASFVYCQSTAKSCQFGL